MQAIKRFPEVIACGVEERLKENMATLERDWKIKGPTAANVIKRQPQAGCCTLKSVMDIINIGTVFMNVCVWYQKQISMCVCLVE